jgi:4-amino-4-deoxy-L-arabinose transferase-like glycosyltransferase
LACGTAVLSKFSAFVFLPPIGLAFLVLAGIRVRPARRAAGQAAMFAAVALAVIWAVYSLAGTKGRRFEDMAESGLQFAGSAHAAKPFRPDARVYGLLHALPILPGPMRAGLVVLAAHARTGHAAYLLGENSSGGWWYYFPVALAVKASLPLLLLLPVAVAALMGQGSRGNGREALYPAAGAVAILATAMAAPINIGIRHALPLFPFLAVAASAACAEGQRRGWRRAIPVVGLVLLLWHGVESARAHPDYLAYFNSIARGREEQFLGDSNLDWGQDLARLGRYVKAAQIEKIHISYFGSARAEFLGIPGAVEFGPQDRPSGWVAISISHTQRISVKGAVPEPGYRRLASYRPYARIGKSILLYRLP